ncbi:CHASE domain-containing protein [Sulfitobacter sp. F26204]|uniref:CHASE domain-containing protein n=1 Tax=Sulfitobacter sp. F26204 TaxID=2996014 RepID=UPI00225E5403|nr:CHASE domain-containing protein [Sulfitobacter sp. F26204]MCX7560278.1 CHASE domain-containing protein [Sulfitobacter sp. F26204]
MVDTHDKPSQQEGQLKLYHIIVLVISLIVTVSAWQYSKRQVENQTQQVFTAARDHVLGLIVERMNKYEDALWAGVAALESHGGDISHGGWKTFARTLRIEERYPGINGIGVTHFHTTKTFHRFLAEQRQFRPAFRTHPMHEYPIFMPITYIEPEEENAAAIGLDLAHEHNRRSAALAARDRGTAQITGPITLVQDADRTAGFLFFAPVYRGGKQPDIERRRDRFLGTVYAPFVVHRLMEGLLAKELRQVRFSIIDEDELIYDEHSADDPVLDPSPMFREEIPLNLYGRTWLLDIRTDRTFRQNHDLSKPTLILVGGLFVEALIVLLFIQMSWANSQAVRYADDVTADLRESSKKLKQANAELSVKNDELERFAYIASHDLKTPIRGIGCLTEMIEEDLEDYLASDLANPDVPINLTRIHDRVGRMNDLTQGIMEYSRVDGGIIKSKPINPDKLFTALSLDFGLEPGQLVLISDVETIDADPLGFRRVVENLVGNAIKYHDGAEELRIIVTIAHAGERCQVTVKDNGPGIAQEFHKRIFEVFQTLRLPGAPESTGIGLSIVKKTVEQHGGTINLMSSPGAGATFGFDWPLPEKPALSPGMEWVA